ncbi:NUDIX domain-containing protein [Flavobacteriaceae bacterium]|jgi:8-oxo-dGTP pyrophosphatase MutT (NUDIX family)|nr:NUDIX domain-containing protein [Flavobacteriaceae bacterium]MDB2328158.1 NUDIX domain-containing protein [Flavobacteriaceae bacterium]
MIISKMYKVFYNQKPIFLTSELNKNSNEFPLFFAKYTTVGGLMKALKSKKVSGAYFYHPIIEKAEKHFIKLFPKVEAAGGLVSHTDGKYLFIFRNGKWDLPKGKIEKKEIVLDAAVREVNEETGVSDLIVKKPLPRTYHIYKANGRYKLKLTHWFLMKTNYKAKLVPQIEENIQKAEWKSKDEISETLNNAYENIKIVVESIQ